jgi:hypothetical protein
MPEPRVHDEFSYLLSADTFTHGRLSNPTHPMWVHFESFHIIHRPSYASKYMPAQGLFLALGQWLSGHVVFGLWISFGLACASICWMLQAWLPPSWALLGGLLAIVRFGFLGHAFPADGYGYWSQSYWGGSVACMGGAITFGALRRIVAKPNVSHALLMALGMAVLAASRPFEGLLVCLPASAALLFWMSRSERPRWRQLLKIVALPIGTVLAATLALIGFYNFRITGNPLRMPYQIHEEAYGLSPLFLWQAPKEEPVYRHKVIHDFYTGWILRYYMSQRSLSGFLIESEQKVTRLWFFYLGLFLTPPLLMLPWVLRNRWMQFALLSCAIVMCGLLSETWVWPHYAAPMAGVIFCLVLQGFRQLRLWRFQGQPAGLFVARVIPLACIASLVVPLGQHLGKSPQIWSLERARILKDLENIEGQQLVIVRYEPSHDPADEWVYNEADIDGARVVWAREMDSKNDIDLLSYFTDRRIWLLLPDSTPVRLAPYRSLAAAPFESSSLDNKIRMARKTNGPQNAKP